MSKNCEHVKRAQRRKKQYAVNQFGGKCQICGYNKCIDALEFHHLNKEEKKESPSYIIMRWAWEKAFEELKKCILICSNCHKEIHSKSINTDLQCYVYKWEEKECKRCHKKFPTKENSNQIYCSSFCYQLDSRKVTRPSKEELKKLLNEKIPWIHLGKMFSVSDNAVRKWARGYNLIGVGTRAAE